MDEVTFDPPRELTEYERAILDFLLDGPPFPGRDELRLQAHHVKVTSASLVWFDLELHVPRDSAPPAAVAESVPVDAMGRSPTGVLVEILLHVADGYLDQVEFCAPADPRVDALPLLESLHITEWAPMPDGNGRYAVSEEPPWPLP